MSIEITGLNPDETFDWECEHGKHCFRAACLKEFARRSREAAAASRRPVSRGRYRKPRVNGFKTVSTLSLTVDNDAIAVLEGMCREDDVNRSRFITNLILREGIRRHQAKAQLAPATGEAWDSDRS